MARYRESLCKVCRRAGDKLFLKGDRCFTEKCSVERRKYPPGQHGQRRSKVSDYGVQLREKQKLRNMYGMLMEKQFKKYYETAASKKGVTGEMLLQLLEGRLDNMVYRMGFASNRRQARQLINHGFFLVNGRAVNIPSCQVRVGDVVAAAEKGRKLPSVEDSMQKALHRGTPGWLEVDSDNFKGKMTHVPSREDIQMPVHEQLIVELYSK